MGYDIHAIVEGRPLVLGGVEIPSPRGLMGHSDADALLHAIADALLGAAALGDIGTHFPPDDPVHAGISSVAILSHAGRLLRDEGWQVVNVDATVVAESPKLAPYTAQMRRCIGETLGVASEQISVKASTNEGLGPVGRGEAIAVYAVALIDRAP